MLGHTSILSWKGRESWVQSAVGFLEHAAVVLAVNNMLFHFGHLPVILE